MALGKKALTRIISTKSTAYFQIRKGVKKLPFSAPLLFSFSLSIVCLAWLGEAISLLILNPFYIFCPLYLSKTINHKDQNIMDSGSSPGKQPDI